MNCSLCGAAPGELTPVAPAPIRDSVIVRCLECGEMHIELLDRCVVRLRSELPLNAVPWRPRVAAES